MNKKNIKQSSNFGNRSSSVSKNALGPIKIGNHIRNSGNLSSSLRRSGVKSASKNQTSRRRLPITNNSSLPRNPYFEP